MLGGITFSESKLSKVLRIKVYWIIEIVKALSYVSPGAWSSLIQSALKLVSSSMIYESRSSQINIAKFKDLVELRLSKWKLMRGCTTCAVAPDLRYYVPGNTAANFQQSAPAVTHSESKQHWNPAWQNPFPQQIASPGAHDVPPPQQICPETQAPVPQQIPPTGAQVFSPGQQVSPTLHAPSVPQQNVPEGAQPWGQHTSPEAQQRPPGKSIIWTASRYLDKWWVVLVDIHPLTVHGDLYDEEGGGRNEASGRCL